MKFLVLLLLFITNCTNNKKDQEKIIEVQNIISSVEKQDFSIFDKYFSKEQLFPILNVKNGYFIQYYGISNTYTINSNKSITNHYSFPSIGKTIIYTNKYDIPFINTEELLISINILTNLPQAYCSGFSDIVLYINNAQEKQNLLAIDYDFLKDKSFTIFLYYRVKRTLFTSILSMYSNTIPQNMYNKLETTLNNISDSSINKYLINQMIPVEFHNKKIILLNYLISLIFTSQYNENNTSKLHVPYIVSDSIEAPCVIWESNE